jgi:hypothetical protein
MSIARLILAMKSRQENFKRSMFDIKIDLDEISLNMNRDQVKTRKKKTKIFILFRFSQYSDLLDLLKFQDYLSVKSKYIKYQTKNDQEEKSSLKQ